MSVIKTAFLISCIIGIAFTEPTADLVDSLTDVPGFNLTMYSGYLNFTSLVSNTMRHMHYVFIETTAGPSTSYPVVMWMNGGPGCSSMEGLFVEIGPYVLEDGMFTLNGTWNQWTWLEYANLLFIDSPVGVGFSYDYNDHSHAYNDYNTAQDNLLAVQTFYTLFPDYKSQDFWITGESYAGIYIPFLAYWITQNDTSINLKGVMIGNGVAKHDTLSLSELEYSAQRGFLSSDLKNLTYKSCTVDVNSPSCKYAQQLYGQITQFQNPYDVYGYCWNQSAYGVPTEWVYYDTFKTTYVKTPWYKPKQVPLDDTSIPAGPPCCWVGFEAYLANVSVMIDLHVNTQITFSECNNTVGVYYNQNMYNGSYWILPLLKKAGVKILIYNGDADNVVPFNDFYAWFPLLNWGPPIKPWQPYYSANTSSYVNVGGFVEEYDGLTFLTVRGAGHMVPQYRRSEGQYMFATFLRGLPFN